LKCQVDDEYIKQRQRVGTTHARIGLPFNTYFAGMNMFITVFRDLLEEKEGASQQQNNTMVAMAKLMHLDTSIVVESYMQMVNETISAQTKSLMEMSTPVTQIWDGILLLPVVGIIDSKRAQDIMNATLEQIAKYHARIYILDIGGVAVVDTAVANHLIKITKATALMGCESIISGLSPAIAQTIVELGIDVGTVKTTATMQDALSSAFQQTGMDIVEVQHDG
jgi:rsbT co-antagonist protein RsbR